jgi:hypothetical protein
MNPERIAAMQEGRRKSTRKPVPKAFFSSIVQSHCLECNGFNPAYTNCQGTTCLLYPINTREKRMKTTKTVIKRTLKKECFSCMGNSHETCTSPDCQLYKLNNI